MVPTTSDARVTGAPTGFPATPRFQYVATLGRGGMGCVYEALDRERGIAVALKTLLEISPQRILYLKREFRALRDVHHPNLVSLGDLVEVEGSWFFTMELLRGPDLLEYVRGADAKRASVAAPSSNGSTTALSWSHDSLIEAPDADPVVPPPAPSERVAPVFDEANLRDALRQLVRGLMALHAVGLVHRDIKPSNILVEDGRVVLLDFGIVGRLEGEPHDGSIAGTWPYAAPEQLRGDPPSPAVDSYALGMCMFEALVGRLPLRGRPQPWRVASRPAPDPNDYARDLPADLATLCTRLLDPDPVRRPAMREVLELLDARAPDVEHGEALVAAEPAFVGRGAELDMLERAFEASRYGEPVCALVHGESGVGKTRLVHELLARTRRNRPSAVILAARCHARELVPYGAIDGIVDGLAQYLGSPAAPALDDDLPAGIGALVRVFPVLATVPAIARASTPASVDDASSRAAAFTALRELLARLADERTLILSIDDLHWAGPDSLKLLAELFAPGRAVPALLVATLGAHDSDAAQAMVRASGCRVETIQVRPLDERAAAALARGIAAALADHPELDAEVIARDAGGHPLFIAELVHHALERVGAAKRPGDLDSALLARVAGLPAAARALLEVVTVAASPIAHEIAALASALDTADYADPLARLARANLVRVTGVRRADQIEPYHKRVQAVVASTLAAERRRELHRALAVALDDRGGTPETLAVHYELAGMRERAGHHAERAAARATSALAFERAAAWYRKALELTSGGDDQRRRLAVALADVLVDAGQPLDAAETYRGAAATGAPSAAERFELRRRSADQYLVGGYVPQGVAAMRELLDEIGQGAPRSRALAALKVGFDRARLIRRGVRFVPREAASVPPEQLAAIDVCWSGMSGVGQVDGMQGAMFALRGTLLSLECGEPMRVARALSMFSITEATLGHRVRAQQSLAASWHAARLAGTAHARFYPQLTELVTAYQVDHDWQRCLDGCRAAEQTWREAGRGRGWESNFIDVYTLLSLYRLGEVKSAIGHGERLLAIARASRNRFLEVALRLLFSFRYLALDRPGDALADLEDAFSSWSASLDDISHQHYWRLVARTQIALYRGIAPAERDTLEAEWRRMYRARLGRMGMYRIETQRALALFAIARASEAYARDVRRHWLARSASWIRELERTASPLASEYALEISAAHATVAGEPERAIATLRTLIPRLDVHRHRLSGMVARWSLAQLVGGSEGAELASTVNAWAEREGVRDLDRLARTVLPAVAPQRGTGSAAR